jgi:hypothetical protein
MSTSVVALNEIHDIWDFPARGLEVSKTKLVADPLLLSCVVYRLTVNPVDGVDAWSFTLQDSNAISKHITSEDHILADAVREHFTAKIMLAVLREDPITKFRATLGKCLKTDYRKDDSYEVPSDYLCIFYKLPFFYHYDIELKAAIGTEYKTLSTSNILSFDTENKRLTFIKKLRSHVKGQHPNEFWFRDENDDIVMLTVGTNNALCVLFENHLVSNKEVSVRGKFRAGRRDALGYYKSSKWVLNL